LELERGLRFQFNLDPHCLGLIAQFDGKNTVAEAIRVLARSSGLTVEQTTRSRAFARAAISGLWIFDSRFHQVGTHYNPPGGGTTRGCVNWQRRCVMVRNAK
jgi:hypothetical protein